MNDLCSLQKVFSDRIFRIPDYQRGYSWGIKQLSELWEDLVNLPEEKDHYVGMLTLRQIDEKVVNSDSWYATRWLVENKSYEPDYVVDGQQRLTTFIILVSVIVDFCKKQKIKVLNDETIDEIVRKYLYLVKPGETYNTYIFGYETDNPSYNYFKTKILGKVDDGEKSDIVETYYTLNLKNAREFFEEKINGLYEEGGAQAVKSVNSKNCSKEEIEEIFREGGRQAVQKVYRKLTQHMKFNIYNISDDFSVFVTFETMNNRGKRLSTLELLKNRLIYLSTLIKGSEASKMDLRVSINNAWKEIYEYLGKNEINPLKDDDYLQAHWISYFGYQTKEENNFSNSLLGKYFSRNRIAEYAGEIDEEINEGVEADDGEDESATGEGVVDDAVGISDKPLTTKEMKEYVNSIKKLVKYWYALSAPDDVTVVEDGELKTILKRLNRLGYNYFKPLAMVILEKDVAASKKVEALQAMERYIFLHFRLAGNSHSSNRSKFYGLTKNLYHDKVGIDEVVSHLENVDCVQNGILRTDVVYKKVFQNLFDKYDGYYSWGGQKGGLRYFLFEYEESLKNKSHASMKVDPEEFFKADPRDKVSIEHIYPQTPKGRWIELFAEYDDEDQRKKLTGTLGNLLPLSQSVNSSLQNDDFKEKKKRYVENSHSAVEVAMPKNEDGELLPFEEWTPERIQERGLELLRFMAEHWRFRFRNEYDMLEMLGLTFMTDEKGTPWEEFEEELKASNKGEKRTGRKEITEEIIEMIYEEARNVHDGKYSLDEALDKVEDLGMNRNSMNMYIYAFESMMAGKNYTMAINRRGLRYFVEHILSDYGDKYKENILKTLKGRVERYAGAMGNMAEAELIEELENK